MEASKKAMQSYEELKQLRYLSTKHGTGSQHERTIDSLMISPNSTEELVLSKHPHDETDLVLYQFESSFASLAESAAFVLNNSVRSSNFNFPAESLQHQSNNKLMSSFDTSKSTDYPPISHPIDVSSAPDGVSNEIYSNSSSTNATEPNEIAYQPETTSDKSIVGANGSGLQIKTW